MMKVIAPSFAVLDHLDRESLAVRIEFCGRICYKSEDRIDQQSALPFVARMAEHGHNSVLEMGVVTLEVTCKDKELINDFFLARPRYLQISRDGARMLVSGSIRAFRELLLSSADCAIIRTMCAHLNERHPYFFASITPEKGWDLPAEINVRKVPLDEISTLSQELLARHRHIAVKFITNRAVTHEIVRHRPCSFLQESQRYCRYSDAKFGAEVTFIRPLFFKENSPEYALWQQAMLETEKLYLKLLESATPQAARTVLPNSCKTEIIVYANLEEWRHIFKLRTSKAAEPSMRELMIPLQQDFAQRFPAVFG